MEIPVIKKIRFRSNTALLDPAPGVYLIWNRITNKTYGGSTTNIKRRFREHRCRLKNYNHGNSALQEDYNKYGINSFRFIVSVHDLDVKRLITEEQRIFDLFKFEETYNARLLVDRNLNCPNEGARKRMLGNTFGSVKWSEERKKEQSINLKWLWNSGAVDKKKHSIALSKATKGRKISEKQRKVLEKVWEDNKHRIISEETRRRLSVANKGKKHSKEHHIKVIQTKKKNGTYYPTEETKQKLSAASQKMNASEKGRIKNKNHSERMNAYFKTEKGLAQLKKMNEARKITELRKRIQKHDIIHRR